MKGICELYRIETELRESHIYPKFVIDYTKKTGSKYLRKFDNPNKRQQDGIKLHLLSEKAEQEFSKGRNGLRKIFLCHIHLARLN